MLDTLAPGFLYSVAKDVVGRLLKGRRKLSQSDVVALRKKWKAEFEPHIWKQHQQELRRDVIIRDMKRVDNYPNIDERARGISPWFRASLVGTYHKGVQIGLAWEELTQDAKSGRLRKTNYGSEPAGIKALLIGLIPYENIENVDWDGDEFYNYPHIYTHFSFRRQPYEHVAYYEETRPPHGLPLYSELATYKDVRRQTKKAGAG